MLIEGVKERVLGVFLLANDLLVDSSEEDIVISQLFDGDFESFFFALEKDKFSAVVGVEISFDFFL